jgi:hypothetical protein
MYLLTPKIPMPEARPANSAAMLPKSARPSTIMVKKVMRRPNSSRIRSDRPLPVIAPMRAAISCTTISAMVVGISVHSSV